MSYKGKEFTFIGEPHKADDVVYSASVQHTIRLALYSFYTSFSGATNLFTTLSDSDDRVVLFSRRISLCSESHTVFS